MAQAVSTLNIVGRFAAVFFNAAPQPIAAVPFIMPQTRGFTYMEREELTLILRRCDVLINQLARGSTALVADLAQSGIITPIREMQLALAKDIHAFLFDCLEDVGHEALYLNGSDDREELGMVLDEIRNSIATALSHTA